MKMVKRILSASVIAAMALSVGMIAHAEDTATTADAITIDSIVFSAHDTDDTLVNAKVAFTAVETAEEVTILMSTDANVADNADIMYINQVAQPESGEITFAIEKARILAALPEGTTDINGTTLYAKMGGTDIDTMASLSKVLSLVADYIAGDPDGDGKVTSTDAILTLRKEAGWTLVNVNFDAMDVDADDKITSTDAILMLRKEAGWTVELKK